MMKHSKFLGAAALLLIGIGIGAASGYIEGKANSTSLVNSINQSLSPIEEGGTSYTFVRPLIAYRTPEAVLLGDYVSLKNSVQSIIDSATSSGTASRVSFYFRDLDAARWIGINQNDTYYPASLLKVPAMIAFYKEAEDNGLSVLSQTVVYDPSVVPKDPFTSPSGLVGEREYSIQKLIDSMIVDSDNGATYTLLNHINPDLLHAVYVALGIQDPGDDSTNYMISSRTYGLFFRILYNATYLSPAYSEKALKLLSKATFVDGLVAGVPEGTVVAHKYGDHVLSSGGTVTGVELSDCGIVYYPAHPYLLCVMTAAANTSTASSIIANISRATYSAVAEKYATTSPAL